MNIKEIEELLEKYYEGETSLDEEKILKDFFLSGNVPTELVAHANQFLYFAEASGDEMTDQDLERKVFGEGVDIPVVSMHSRRNRFYYLSGIAATVLLLIGLIFTFRESIINKPKENLSKMDSELAFSQTHDILALVSVNFNKGMDKMEYIGKLDQAMEKMQMLSKYYQYQSIIINPDQLEKLSEKTKGK
jgi:hypothetical protein